MIFAVLTSENISFRGAILDDPRLSGANMQGIDLSQAVGENIHLFVLDLDGADLTNSNFAGRSLVGLRTNFPRTIGRKKA